MTNSHLTLLILVFGLTGAARAADLRDPVFSGPAAEILDVEVDPGVTDPRGEQESAPAAATDAVVCTNVVCGDDALPSSGCTTCSAPTR